MEILTSDLVNIIDFEQKLFKGEYEDQISLYSE